MQLNIPEGDFAGYIFDLDGTLVNTMPLHYFAWRDTLREFGLKPVLDEALFYAQGGSPTEKVVQTFNAHYGTSFDPITVRDAKELRFVDMLSEAKLIEPVVAFARARAAEGRPVSVASGGLRHIVRDTLHAHGLAELFPVIVTADDVAHGKPAPDTFLLAAEKMGVPPEQCLVFEDAALGIRAAEAAGMRWVEVPPIPLVHTD
ncbi:beta-phosphoglucomutase [Cephaloticoccus primus]|uniref:Beta-phosphoglucomutase n=2 Tax=Cephaloticoccus primus TaxID=1548207 RepID=A0A139STM4_9BACT|nr:beta-phosphoglucomutase [Cephaloticoccus primus]